MPTDESAADQPCPFAPRPGRSTRRLLSSAAVLAGTTALLYVLGASGGEPGAAAIAVPPLPAPRGEVIHVATVEELLAAVDRVMPSGTILIADGQYRLPRVIVLEGKRDITLRGASADAVKVTLTGRGWNSGAQGDDLIHIGHCDGVTIADLTFADCRSYGIKVEAENAPRNIHIYRCRFRDIGVRAIKGSAGDDPETRAVKGSVRGCTFENTWVPPADWLFGGDYIAAIDMMALDDWTFSDNVFRNIKGRNGGARAAIFIWVRSRQVVVERNRIIDCDRGIAFGNPGQSTANLPGERLVYVADGVIRNNFVAGGPDCGIELWHADRVKVLHNTIWRPERNWARGIRVGTGTAHTEIANNLVHGEIRLEGGEAEVRRNLAGRLDGYFVDPASGNLALTPAATGAIDQAEPRSDVPEDIRGRARPDRPDLGAWELDGKPEAGAAAAVAVPVDDFLNSIGVCSAVSRRGEDLANTVNAVRYLGARWVRAGYESGVPVADLIELHRQTGVRFSYGLMSGGTDIARLLEGARQLAAAGALIALEGNNEPNNWGVSYEGQRGGRTNSWLPVAKLQRDLYRAVKSDPVLKDYPVWSLSENGAQEDNVGLQFLTIPRGAGTLMPDDTLYADYANCHNYLTHPGWPGLHDNQTWVAADPTSACRVDGLYGNYGRTWRRRFPGYSEADLLTLPRVTTETGVTLGGAITEPMQARLYLSVYLDQFKRGWKHTAIYLLRDRTDEQGNQTFGFYRPDYTPRLAATYLHNLTTILADQPSTAAPDKLDYSIPDQPDTVHDLLLRKGDGTFALLIWDERFTDGSDRITVNLRRRTASARLFDPTVTASPLQNLSNVDSVDLTLSNHPAILEIPGQKGPP